MCVCMNCWDLVTRTLSWVVTAQREGWREGKQSWGVLLSKLLPSHKDRNKKIIEKESMYVERAPVKFTGMAACLQVGIPGLQALFTALYIKALSDKVSNQTMTKSRVFPLSVRPAQDLLFSCVTLSLGPLCTQQFTSWIWLFLC